MPKESASIVEKILEAYKKYAPKNITFAQFTEMIDKDPSILRDIENGTLGEFSTFDVKLSRRFRQLDRNNINSKDDFRNLLKDSMDDTASNKRVKDIAKIYEEIISSDDEILKYAWTFDILDMEQKQQLSVRIINAMNKYFNISKVLDVEYTGKALNRLPKSSFSYSVYVFIDNFLTKFWPKKSKYGRYGGYFSNSKKQIVISYKQSFDNFISTLSHEYAHFIDYNYPNLGMLGSQIAHYAEYVYDNENGNERYRANPTEASSFKIGEAVMNHIKTVLKEQSIKKPKLYRETLQSALDKLNAEFAGVNLKVKKALQEYTSIQEKIRLKKRPNFYELSNEERERIWAEIDQDPRLKDYARIEKEYSDVFIKIKSEKYPYFYDLPEEEQIKIWEKIDQDPRVYGGRKVAEEYYELLYSVIDEICPDYDCLLEEKRDEIYKKAENSPKVEKLRKIYESVRDLRYEIRDEMFPDFYSLSSKEQDNVIKEINQDPRVAKLYQKYKAIEDLRDKIRVEKYPNFYELSNEEREKLEAKIKRHPLVRIAQWKYDLAHTKEYWDKYYPVMHYERLLKEFDADIQNNMAIQSDRAGR